MAGKQTQSSPSQRPPIAVCRKNKANFCFYLLGIRRGGASRFFSSHRHLSLVTVLKREHELLDLAAPLFSVCGLPPVQAFVQRELLLGALLVLGADQSLSQAVMRVGEARVELGGSLVLHAGVVGAPSLHRFGGSGRWTPWPGTGRAGDQRDRDQWPSTALLPQGRIARARRTRGPGRSPSSPIAGSVRRRGRRPPGPARTPGAGAARRPSRRCSSRSAPCARRARNRPPPRDSSRLSPPPPPVASA